jgi:hypothetical protein
MTVDRPDTEAALRSRVPTRRQRQLLEIARLVDRGERARAAGLALEHAAEFPGDAEVLGRLAPP